MLVFPVDWCGLDHNDQYEIRCYGKRHDGTSVLLRISFIPYFFVKVPDEWSEARQKFFINRACTKLRALGNYSATVRRTSLLGFTNNYKAPFVQLAFASLVDARKAKYGLSWLEPSTTLKTYEASLDPLLRFFHVRQVDPSAWMEIQEKDIVTVPSYDEDRISIESVMEYKVDFRAVSKPGKSQDDIVARPPALVLASWDLECISAKGMFPNADNPGDCIITIGTAFQKYGDNEPYHRAVVTLGTCDAIDGVEVVACETEHEVVNTWLDLLRKHDVDVMIGYNTSGFDYKYLDGRAAVCVDDNGTPLIDLHNLGKSLEGGGLPIEKNLSSSAYGDNKYFLLSSSGIMQLDLLQIFRKELKLESYSLANVSKKYLEDGEEKIDLKPSEIFRKFQCTSADRADIAVYCIRDVELPLKLMKKLATLENVLEMSNATCVPVEFLQSRGQQIRVYSLLTRKGRSLGFVAPDQEYGPKNDDAGGLAANKGYEGATVLNAEKGVYYDPISALDFASLYPSIMRAHNMCPSTLVLDRKYDNVHGIEYYTIQTGLGASKFAQSVQSVVPELLKDLSEFRKWAKKDMADAKSAGDTFKATMFNAKQLAFKVSMNSVYGFFGATKGLFPCLDIAAAVTATGRHMIEHSKKLAEELVPGTSVIYGDSVAEYTPTIVRDVERGPYFTTFEELGRNKDWNTCALTGKEFCSPEAGLSVWTDEGWVIVERIIRHKLSPEKKMVRVATSMGVVDVTSDHSLLLSNGTPVKPADIQMGTKLLHVSSFPDGLEDIPDDLEPTNQLNAAKVFMWGIKSGLHAYVRHKVDSNTATCTPQGISLEFWREKVGNADAVIGMQFIKYDGEYVYDLTTSNHRFCAGVGAMVVHNTDSILCKFHLPHGDMTAHFETAQKVADTISATFKEPIELEFEKVYMPYMLFSKKRYAGMMYTKPEAPDYMDVKGLQLVRRDNAPIVKEVSANVLESVLVERSSEKAVEVARNAVRMVLNGEYPLEKYIISKALRATYVNPQSQPHVIVAQKIKQRRGYAVAYGERIPYVFVADADNADGLLSTRAEDPEYVRENPAIQLDCLYYIHNQLLPPLTTLLELLVPNVSQAILQHPGIKEPIEALKSQRDSEVKIAKRVKTNKSRGQREITTFFMRD